MDFEYIKGQRGNDVLVFEGFLYNKDKQRQEGIRWRCQNRSCKGSLIITNSNLIINSVVHNHSNEVLKIEKLTILDKIKNRALETTESSSSIVVRAIRTIENNDLKTEMPSISSMIDGIRKKRNKKNKTCSISYEDFPDSIKTDHNGNPFLIFDSGVESDNRFVIFSYNFKKKFIEKSKNLLIDGTFRSTPPGFYQILTIYGELFGRFYPLIYILLKNKLETSYMQSLEKVKEFFLVEPEFIICDFEKALINAIRNQFRSSRINGCLFHFGQSIWKRIQSSSLVNIYKTDTFFKKGVKLMILCSFVPVYDVQKAYKKIKNWMISKINVNLSDFFDYFEINYIGIYNDEDVLITEPRYEIGFWNVYLRILKYVARTINAAESWHRILNFRNQISHPNIAQLVNEILNEETKNEFDLTRAIGGILIPSKNLKKEEKIRIYAENYDFMETLDYLNALDSVYKFKFESEKN